MSCGGARYRAIEHGAAHRALSRAIERSFVRQGVVLRSGDIVLRSGAANFANA